MVLLLYYKQETGTANTGSCHQKNKRIALMIAATSVRTLQTLKNTPLKLFGVMPDLGTRGKLNLGHTIMYICRTKSQAKMAKTEDTTPFVFIQPIEDVVHLTWRVRVIKKKNEMGTLSCYAPGFDIFFGAKDEDAMIKKAVMLSRFFFDHYLKHGGKSGLKKLVLQLHSMGFKTNNDFSTIHSLINNKLIPAKFKSYINKVPSGFISDGTEVFAESKMAVAAED